jgi:hypothetical protein
MLFDTRKSLLSLYSDNTLEHGGYAFGLVIAVVGEAASRSQIQALFQPYFDVFPALLVSTIVLTLLMLVRSGFWGRMTYVAVLNDFPLERMEGKTDPMKEMYLFHVDLAKKDYRWLYKFGYSALRWPLALTIVSFFVTLAASILVGY